MPKNTAAKRSKNIRMSGRKHADVLIGLSVCFLHILSMSFLYGFGVVKQILYLCVKRAKTNEDERRNCG